MGEVFSLGTKVIAAPIATAILFGIGAIADLVFSIMIDELGFGTFLVFASFALMVCVLVLLCDCFLSCNPMHQPASNEPRFLNCFAALCFDLCCRAGVLVLSRAGEYPHPVDVARNQGQEAPGNQEAV